MKNYNIKAKFTTTVDFPIIEAENKKDAIEKAKLILLTDKHLEESREDLVVWKVGELKED